MNIRGFWRLRQATRWLRNQIAPGVLVLMYHQVADVASDPFQLAVSPRHFNEQMEVLRKQNYRVLRLQELAGALRGKPYPRRLYGLEKIGEYRRGQNLPRRAVVITFDDGYADNLHNARPILERWEAPATVFVTTGYVGKQREYWWNELERLILQPNILPDRVCLTIHDEIREWDLGEAARYSEEAFRTYRQWHGAMPDLPTPRHRLFLELHQWLRPMPEPDQRRVLDQLVEMTGSTTTRPGYFAVSLEELHRLADGGLIEIGAHTMTHPVLAAHAPERQRDEIVQSKIGLEKMLDRPVTSFACPYGTEEDYTQETIEILRETGFNANCTTTFGLSKRDADPLRLPRGVVRNWDGDRFARELQDYFHE
jgi:peptidoglycan/xylan/chitin deacetylase (PgdA/CDA1 family)